MAKKLERIVHAHDYFFKMAMLDRRVAREFFETHLPADIHCAINLDQLELQSESYINDVRKQSVADLLYRTQIENQIGYLYLIVDHQSKPDVLMPFRILKYTCNIMDQHCRNEGEGRLPLVYPMVIYHGRKPWNFSNDIASLVDAPTDLIKKYFLQPFHLIDLNLIPDEQLKERMWIGVTELALKHIFAKDMMPYLQEFLELLRKIEQSDGKNLVEVVLTYLLDRGEWGDRREFFHSIRNGLSPDIGERIMSLAEQLKLEGREEGREEGRVEGHMEGFTEGKMEVAKRLLEEGVEPAFVAKITDVSLEKIKTFTLKQEY